MTTRYWVETECEHGEMRRHRDSIPGKGGVGPICLGGRRRELTGVEVVEVIMREIEEGFTVWSPIVRKPGRYAIIPLEEPADG